MTGLEIRGLSIGHGTGPPLATEVTAAVSAGQAVAVVGASGAGKTTLLRTLAGELPPRAGSVRVAGGGPRFPEVALADQFPERQFFATTVAEEVSFAARALGRAVPPGGVREGLQGVGLDAAMASRSPWTLSVGEQRRVAIASLLVVEPRVLLLDEPTASLDTRGRADLGALVTAFRARGGTVLMAGHDWMWSLPLADRAWVVGAGVVTEHAPDALMREAAQSDPDHSDAAMYGFFAERLPNFWKTGAWRLGARELADRAAREPPLPPRRD